MAKFDISGGINILLDKYTKKKEEKSFTEASSKKNAIPRKRKGTIIRPVLILKTKSLPPKLALKCAYDTCYDQGIWNGPIKRKPKSIGRIRYLDAHNKINKRSRARDKKKKRYSRSGRKLITVFTRL